MLSGRSPIWACRPAGAIRHPFGSWVMPGSTSPGRRGGGAARCATIDRPAMDTNRGNAMAANTKRRRMGHGKALRVGIDSIGLATSESRAINPVGVLKNGEFVMRGVMVVVVVVAVCALAAPAGAQEKKTVTAGPEYKATPTLRRWFGEGYRDVWTTPVEVPVLDLKTEGGGLVPVRQVGGLQTAGLAMRGADGTSYTFRSLHKEPERLL